jgi:hypothetical protein
MILKELMSDSASPPRKSSAWESIPFETVASLAVLMPSKPPKVTLEVTLDDSENSDDEKDNEIKWGRRDLNPEPTDYEFYLVSLCVSDAH